MPVSRYKKSIIVLLAIVLTAVAGFAVGCGGGSGTTDACVKNPWLCYTGIYFSPVDGQTGVEYDGTTFSIVFPKSLDSNTTSSITGFSITIKKTSTGDTFTINYSNYSDYGSFLLGSSNTANDTLSFKLKSNSTLESAGLHTLEPSTAYTITNITMPTNLLYTDGTSPDYSGMQTTGSFTTKSSS